MLDKQFKHRTWFKDSNITVKEFLDYAITKNGDFIIKEKSAYKTNDLFETPEKVYYLSDRKYNYKLNYEECSYLAEHNEYFKSKLSA